jgi:hypothetical protein
MKQTAVEWLYEKILLTPLDIREINKCLKQAKEMEKEQIETAFIKGNEFLSEWNITNVPYIDAEQYYNETFKSE